LKENKHGFEDENLGTKTIAEPILFLSVTNTPIIPS
jgi:hypothetical protein